MVRYNQRAADDPWPISAVFFNLVLTLFCQQLTYGVVSEGFFAESLRKFCGNSRKLRGIASGKGAEILRKVCGNFAKIFGKFSAMTPFPNDPISELLTFVSCLKMGCEVCAFAVCGQWCACYGRECAGSSVSDLHLIEHSCLPSRTEEASLIFWPGSWAVLCAMTMTPGVKIDPQG